MYKIFKAFSFQLCGGLRHTKRWYLWHDYRYKGKEVNWVKKVNHHNYMYVIYNIHHNHIVSLPNKEYAPQCNTRT